MIEQLITELIAALKENTAALNSSRNVTATLGTSYVATIHPPVEVKPATTEEPKSKTRKGKTAAPPAEETVIPPAMITLEEVRNLGQQLVSLAGTSDVIRAYVTKELPGMEKPALRFLAPEQLPAAREFLLGEIAKLQKAA